MAGPSIQIDLKGHEELNKLFNALPVTIQRSALRPALRAGTKVMLEFVKKEAPRSSDAPHVAETLRIKAMKRKRGRIGLVVISGRREVLGITNPETYYPAHLEYGYRKKSGKHIPANPWMKRGLEAGRSSATEAIAAELTRRLKRFGGLEDATDDEFFSDVDVDAEVGSL